MAQACGHVCIHILSTKGLDLEPLRIKQLTSGVSLKYLLCHVIINIVSATTSNETFIGMAQMNHFGVGDVCI